MPLRINSPSLAYGVGDPAEDFALKSSAGEVWRLSDHIGKVVTLLFYPQNECIVCTRQLCSVRDLWKEYVETKSVIVGITAGEPEENHRITEKYELPFPILADPGWKVTFKYGFHWILPPKLSRAVVVVDANGIIRARHSMARVFRPNDKDVLRSIYKARSEALENKYQNLRAS